jgi:hypothetical protein
LEYVEECVVEECMVELVGDGRRRDVPSVGVERPDRGRGDRGDGAYEECGDVGLESDSALFMGTVEFGSKMASGRPMLWFGCSFSGDAGEAMMSREVK